MLSAPLRLLRANRALWPIAVILLIGLALRAWPTDAGGRLDFVPDAAEKLAQMQAVADGNLRPPHARQPGFLLYFGGTAVALARVIGASDRTGATAAVIACSLLMIAGTWWLATVLTRRRDVAALAASIVAVVPIEVVGARYLKEDVPVAAWVALALATWIAAARRGGRGRYAIAGVLTGVAIGAKYSAGLVVPFGVALFVVARFGCPGTARPGSGSAWLAAAGGAAAFFACNPYALVDVGPWWAGALYQLDYAAAGHHDGTAIRALDHGFAFYFTRALAPGVSWPVALAAVAAIAGTWTARRRDVVPLVAAAWGVALYLVFELTPAKPFPFFARYLHPLVPLVAVAAATFALWLTRLGGRVGGRRQREAGHTWDRSPHPGRDLAQMLLPWALLIAPMTRTVAVLAGIDSDTRDAAAAWIATHVPLGVVIALDDRFHVPRLPERGDEVRTFGLHKGERVFEAGSDWIRRSSVGVFVTSSFRVDRYAAAADNPTTRLAREFYAGLDRDFVLSAELKPRWSLQTYGFHNPIVRIYEARARPYRGRRRFDVETSDQ